ncbi:MAG: hypothetical protein RR821_03315 [Clostridia bacterium]
MILKVIAPVMGTSNLKSVKGSVVGQVVKMRHFMKHGGRHIANGPVDILGANVNLAAGFLAAFLPDFMDAAPAIGSASTVRRYGDSRTGQFVRVKVMVEKSNISSVLATISDTFSMVCAILEVMFQCRHSLPDHTVIPSSEMRPKTGARKQEVLPKPVSTSKLKHFSTLKLLTI